jgi:hypothetical protein
MTTTRIRRRALVALALGLTVTLWLGSATPASAGRPKPPRLVLTGGDHWFTHDVGWFPVVQGPAQVQLGGGRTLGGTLSATVQPDDHTMPPPGECEGGMVFVHVKGERRAADVMLVSVGDLCGHHVQAPTSIVTHSFTGTTTVEESRQRCLVGREGFLDIRMAEDGSAFVFASIP